MAKLNDLDDVTIDNPKVGDVVKYTASGWQNGADSTSGGVGGNPCGNLDGYPQSDSEETITDTWTWEVGDGKCGVVVEHQDGVNNLGEGAKLCPGRVEAYNKNGKIEMKTFDSGNSRINAFDNQLSFQDVNNPTGVTLAELVACCDGSSGGGSGGGGGGSTTINVASKPIMVNFPTAGVATKEVGSRALSAWTPTEDNSGETFDPRWYTRDFYDIFDAANNGVTVELPEGSNAAVIFCFYPVTITSTSLNPNYTQGYANVTLNYQMTDNKGSLTTSPGPLAAPVKLRTEIVGWSDAQNIGGGNATLQDKRTPALSNNGSKAIRVSYELSTPDSPTRLVINPLATINRARSSKVIVGSGRVVVLPYYDNGSDPFASVFNTDPEDIFLDDGGLDKAFEQAQDSHDLKEIMNYYTNAIRETLDYDENLAEEGKPILTQALKDIFGLKQEQVDDLDYYYNRLATIKTLVLPYVGFKFGFETENTTLSF